MAPSGISVNKPAAIAIIILLTGGGILYHWGFSPFSSSIKETDHSHSGAVVDFDQLEKELIVVQLQKAPSANLDSFQVTETTVDVATDGQTLSVFTRQTSPKDKEKGTVVLLHGQKFKSDNWQDIGTLSRLALWGFKAIAVDLPGFGATKGPAIDQTKTELFLQDLVKALKVSPTQLVLVSPSMSGRFSLPYLFSNEAVKPGAAPRAMAFVPVAPVSVEAFAPAFDTSQLPTLVVYGSNDKSLGETGAEHFKRMPKAQLASIPEAGHACYLDKPEDFHNALYFFLSHLSPSASLASAPSASLA